MRRGNARCRVTPCATCPYRKDAPSGLWSEDEYRKLAAYDRETWAQPREAFHCHTAPSFLCTGWAVCHETNGERGHELLALRFLAARSDREVEIPVCSAPLWPSGAAAMAHGLRDLKTPGRAAREAARRIRAARKRKAGKDS